MPDDIKKIEEKLVKEVEEYRHQQDEKRRIDALIEAFRS